MEKDYAHSGMFYLVFCEELGSAETKSQHEENLEKGFSFQMKGN